MRDLAAAGKELQRNRRQAAGLASRLNNQSTLCVICLDGPKEFAFAHCGHGCPASYYCKIVSILVHYW